MDAKKNADEVITRLKLVTGAKSDKDLAQYFGLGSTTITSKRQRGSVPFDEAVQIALRDGISLDWLILGKGDPPAGVNHPPEAYVSSLSVSLEPGPEHSAVKMYDIEAAAGAGRSFDQEEIEATLYFQTSELEARGLDPARVVGVKVRGDSMDGTLTDGDWALVDLASRDPKQEGVFLLLVSGERRIKRVQRLAGGALYLISDNEHYRAEMIPPEKMHDVEILGRCEIRIGRVL